eukprot:TRINITY_DN10573_c0_g1_i1.p1 TRINITY_DN10573_c0_g1~~TRINITY_DN10573_c0_g1_i1.p1  ORF type:complete len:103 (-),score=10.65 TRINITY_DN10573_c0_g1_i1:39-347(-)
MSLIPYYNSGKDIVNQAITWIQWLVDYIPGPVKTALQWISPNLLQALVDHVMHSKQSEARKLRAKDLKQKIIKKTLKQNVSWDIDRANSIAAMAKELCELVT